MKNKPLLLFTLCCAIPFVLALFAVKFNWLDAAATNYGEFVADEVKITNWQQYQPKPWSIALNYTQDCEQACQQQLASLANLQVALGKNKDKVEMLILGQPQQAKVAWRVLPPLKQLQPASLYLIDHKGLVVLQYPYHQEPQQNRLIQKGLLKDLKKLLNYSRSS